MSDDYHMPVIGGIDWEKAHRYLTTKEALIEVVSEMVSGAEKQTALLSGYKDAVIKDPSDSAFDAFRIQAHSMKASVRSIGSDLFDEAYALEIAGRDRDADTVKNKTDDFVKDYLALSEKLRTVTPDAGKKSGFDETAFAGGIKDIKEAMEAFDVDTIQKCMEMVLSMEIPELYGEEIRRLEGAVRDLESETVIQSCEKIGKLMWGE